MFTIICTELIKSVHCCHVHDIAVNVPLIGDVTPLLSRS